MRETEPVSGRPGLDMRASDPAIAHSLQSDSALAATDDTGYDFSTYGLDYSIIVPAERLTC